MEKPTRRETIGVRDSDGNVVELTAREIEQRIRAGTLEYKIPPGIELTCVAIRGDVLCITTSPHWWRDA